MSLADKMGLGPKRRLVLNPDGTATLYVQPPSWVGPYPETSVKLSPEAVEGYKRWIETDDLIQNCLPMLSRDELGIIQDGGVS